MTEPLLGTAVAIPINEHVSRGYVSAPQAANAALFVLAHGAGGSLQDPLLELAHEALARRGHGVIRFNFLYREARRKLPDKAPLLEETWRQVLLWARRLFPKHASRLVIGGKSLGGRIATHLAAAGEDVSGLLLLGYPLHPAKQPARLRDGHLPQILVPSFFVQGSKDALCQLSLLRPLLARMGDRASLFVVEGGDHSLVVPKKAGVTRAELVDSAVTEACAWLVPS